MKNKITNSLLSLAVGLMLTGLATAQASGQAPGAAPATSSPPSSVGNTQGGGPGQNDPGHPRVDQVNTREQNAQNRIGNSVKNGGLTPNQAANLERSQARIEAQEKRDMGKNGGHLSKAEQRQLNHEENRQEKRITHDKQRDKK